MLVILGGFFFLADIYGCGMVEGAQAKCARAKGFVKLKVK